MTFADELRKWRGNKMAQKNACDVFGVSIAAYRAWEQGVNEPGELAKESIRWRMAASDAGVSLQAYRQRYLSVIKGVASEIIVPAKNLK